MILSTLRKADSASNDGAGEDAKCCGSVGVENDGAKAVVAPGQAFLARSPEHAQALLAVTVGTGIIDAVSYLGLDHVFTANMTGNIILLSLSVENFDPKPLTDAGLALAGFLLGAALAARYLRRAHPRRVWPRESVVVLGSHLDRRGCISCHIYVGRVDRGHPALEHCPPCGRDGHSGSNRKARSGNRYDDGGRHVRTSRPRSVGS